VDDLTCVCNRRGFLQAFETETYRAGRFGEEISFGVIKVEFKTKALIPDFESKNHLLRLLGETLSQSARKCDTCGRLDSETFAILMPKTSEQKARTVCHRLKGVFEQKRFTSDGLSLEITIDLIDFDKDMSDITGEEFLEKTEKWLYPESS